MFKKLFNLLLFFFTLFNTSAQNNNSTISLHVFNVEETSIRAIEVLNDSTVWFAGSNGKFGRIINSKVQIDSIKHQGKPINFRSIASNGEFIFFLSIDNPALLYKINPNIEKLGTPDLVYHEDGENVFYDSLDFFNRQKGIAMGDPTDGCLSVILTSDGGSSWKKIGCDNLPKVAEGEAAFAASNTNIAIYKKNAWIVTGGKKARVFHSRNYGKNWKVYETPIVQGGTMTGIFTTSFVNDKKGIIMGGNWEDKLNTKGTKAKTSDGGKNWKLIDNKAIPGYISCVKYVPESEGNRLVAVSTEGIYYSSTSGDTWQKISDNGFYSIAFVDRDTAWLSGHQKIAKMKLNNK